MQNQIEKKANPESSWTFREGLWYGFISFLIFILTIGVPSAAVFLGIKFLPAMFLWAFNNIDPFRNDWICRLLLGHVPVLCTAFASLILIGCIRGACELFRYLSKLSDQKNKKLKLENSMKRNWLKRILAFFGCIAFGLSTVIVPVCMLVCTLGGIYTAPIVIVALFVMLFMGSSGGQNIDGWGDFSGCLLSGCLSSGFLFGFPGPEAFYYCLKIFFSGENPMHKKYHELRKACFAQINKLLKNESVEKHLLDDLLENAKDVDSSDIEELRMEIVKTILEKKIIPLVVVLAIKQNKSVEQIFGLKKISENQQQGILKFASFKDGIIKLLKSANINKNSNQINMEESMQLSSKEEIYEANQAKYLENENKDYDAAPNILQIQATNNIAINNNKNMDSNKPKHNIKINCNDEDGKKLIEVWNCCSFSIKEYLNDAKNQRLLYENLIQEEKKQKENENEIIVE